VRILTTIPRRIGRNRQQGKKREESLVPIDDEEGKTEENARYKEQAAR